MPNCAADLCFREGFWQLSMKINIIPAIWAVAYIKHCTRFSDGNQTVNTVCVDCPRGGAGNWRFGRRILRGRPRGRRCFYWPGLLRTAVREMTNRSREMTNRIWNISDRNRFMLFPPNYPGKCTVGLYPSAFAAPCLTLLYVAYLSTSKAYRIKRFAICLKPYF